MDGKYTKKNWCLIEDAIDKKIRYDIFSIKEEMSVSSDVRRYVKDITRLISNSLKNRVVYWDNNSGVRRRISKVEFIYTICGNNIKVIATFIEFCSLDERNMCGGLYDLGGRFDSNNKTLYINVPIVGWNSVTGAIINRNEYVGVLSHELEHVHWLLKRGVVSTDYEYGRYERIITIMGEIANDEVGIRLRELAFCLYMCANFERSGFVHGLDGTLTKLKQDGTNKSFQELYDEFTTTNEYVNMKCFEYVLDRIDEYRNLETDRKFKDMWRGSFDDMIKYLKKNYKLLCRGLYRVLYKVSREPSSGMRGPLYFKGDRIEGL